MATFDNSYSRFVAWMKIILPLMALGLLSTLFLFSRGVDTDGSLPFSDVDVEGIAREQRLNAPNFAGVTRDGASIEISARVARPDLDDPQRMTGEALNADIDLPGGTIVKIQAPEAMIDAGKGAAALSGGIEVSTSTGYVLTTPGLDLSLETTSMESHGPANATGPLGKLEAGQFSLSLSDETYLLVFKNGVDLIYQPPKTAGRE